MTSQKTAEFTSTIRCLQEEEISVVTQNNDKYCGEPWRESETFVGTIFYSDGNKYSGELLLILGNPTPHGFGTLTVHSNNSSSSSSSSSNNNNNNNNNNSNTSSSSPNSKGQTTVYEGDYDKGLRKGFGRLRRFVKGISSTMIYEHEGQYVSDAAHGSGSETLWTNDGRKCSSYTGSFKNGLREGRSGLLEDFVRGVLIEGEFLNGLPHTTSRNNNVIKWQRANPEKLQSYNGEMEEGELSGTGLIVLSNGESFRGTFEKGKRKSGIICCEGSPPRKAEYEDGMLVSFEDIETGAQGFSIPVQEKEQQQQQKQQQKEGEQEKDESSSSSSSPSPSRSAGVLESYARIQHKNGDVFVGDVISGQPHGRGVLTFFTGGYYDGEWNLGKYHGKGLLVLTDASDVSGKRPPPTPAAVEEEGEEKEKEGEEKEKEGEKGKEEKVPLTREEAGLLFRRSKANSKECWRYEGDWIDGKMCGHAKMILWNSDEYIGSFQGKRSGTGRMLYHSLHHQDVEKNEQEKEEEEEEEEDCPFWYEGEFSDDAENGLGAKWLKNKCIRGFFVDGSCNDKNASIEYFSPSSSSKSNMNKNNKINTSNHHNREVIESYQGGVVNDCCSGEGEMKYADGSTFFGEFKLGQRHGVGILTLSNGSIFEGRWKNDVPTTTSATLVNKSDNSVLSNLVVKDSSAIESGTQILASASSSSSSSSSSSTS